MTQRKSPDLQAMFGAANLPAIDSGIASMIAHPATSDWLRQALRDNVKRDPVDALKDAEVLQELLELRCNAALLTNMTHGHILRFDDPA